MLKQIYFRFVYHCSHYHRFRSMQFQDRVYSQQYWQSRVNCYTPLCSLSFSVVCVLLLNYAITAN